MMVPGPIAITVLVLYTFSSIFIVYFCVVSNPEDSEIAYFAQVTLPNASWNRLSRIFGDKTMQVLQHLSERFLVLAYFSIVGGCWSVVFGKLYPWLLYESPGLSNIHAFIGVCVFLACFGAWAVANASRPGFITARSFPRYDHYPYDHLMFQANSQCKTTKLYKIPRCKYDRMKYDALVPRYDHFCGWTHNTYGEENYRWFLLFLLQHVIMCFYGTYVCYLLFNYEIQTKRLLELTFFDRMTGETIQASYYIIFQYIFARRTKEVGVTLIMLIMGIALTCFLGYHVYITSMGQTTNENGKWSDIRKWYKKQRKLYHTTVQEGNGMNAKEDVYNDDSEEEKTQDPGPIPKNLYDRGFVANWSEVLFPLSLRKDARLHGGFTKAILQQTSQQQQHKKPESSTTNHETGTPTCKTEASGSSSVRTNKPKDI